MAVRLSASLTGASLLALALPAAAQDHAHHPAPPAATVTAEAQTAPASPQPHVHTTGMVMPPRQPSEAEVHAGHDMSGEPDPGMAAMDHPMTSALGPWPMTRDASGTSWQPDTSAHAGVHWNNGDWSLMSHAQFNLVHDRQSGPRGDDKTFVSGMVMTSARRDFADGSTLNLRAMLSPEPLMGRAGFPQLLAAGETADGVNPLVDRQHPHELVMELSASFAQRLSDTDSVFAYVGLPGEPAFGPPAFMHRMTGMDSPEAPITHHWLDSTHIVFGVATAGWVHDRFKLEASAFRGREPDENRYDIETPKLDSWAVRASWNPDPQWALQVSYADVVSPEQLAPDENETKFSASAIHTRRLGTTGWWSSTLAFGRKINDEGEPRDGLLLESAIHPDERWTVFARAEQVETDELVPGIGHGHGPLYRVAKASLGVVHDWQIAPHMQFGVGGLYAVNRVPSALKAAYGDDATGTMLFVRLKID